MTYKSMIATFATASLMALSSHAVSFQTTPNFTTTPGGLGTSLYNYVDLNANPQHYPMRTFANMSYPSNGTKYQMIEVQGIGGCYQVSTMEETYSTVDTRIFYKRKNDATWTSLSDDIAGATNRRSKGWIWVNHTGGNDLQLAFGVYSSAYGTMDFTYSLNSATVANSTACNNAAIQDGNSPFLLYENNTITPYRTN